MGGKTRSGEQAAQQQFGTSGRAAAFAASQRLNHLNSDMRAFIGRQDMVFIATSDAAGGCDCSFRAGSVGFVHVLDERTLAYPEYRGNGVWSSVGNLLENAHIGLLFLDFTRTTVGLHVNGGGRILTTQEILGLPHLPQAMRDAAQLTGGRRAETWVLVDVEEAYIHCSKHVPLMKRLDKHIAWGSDDENVKGGNCFKTKPNPST